MTDYMPKPDLRFVTLSAHLYHGCSAHPVLRSWEGTFHTLEIFNRAAQIPWWKRCWKRLPSVVEPFVNLTWELSLLERGQRILAEVRPEAGYLDFPRLEQYKTWLDEQMKRSEGVGIKTQCPSGAEKWPDNIFCKQYLFEIHEQGHLINLFDWFRNFEMMDVLILNVDAKLAECVRQLQAGVLDRPFDLENIVESLNAFVYCSSFGDRLIIESPKEDLVDRFLKMFHIEPVLISNHPLVGPSQVSRSLWLGKRRLLP